jgi:hypothetical protein
MPLVELVGRKINPIENPGWDLVGLEMCEATPQDQFDADLGALFNAYTPAYIGDTPGGLALEFVLPPAFRPGRDYDNVPTNSWTVVLTGGAAGIFQMLTTYPGHPVPDF